MDISKLIPLSEVSTEKLKELFDKNENLAWNVRNSVAQNEVFWAQDALSYFGDADIETEFGIYTRATFWVKHDPDSARKFIVGMKKLQTDREILDPENAPFIDQAVAYWNIYANNQNPDTDDVLLELVYKAVDRLSGMFRDYLVKAFKFWEDDEHVKNEIGDFAENHGDHLFLNPTDDTVLEVKKISQWDFY
jgi:hypothetical protein